MERWKKAASPRPVGKSSSLGRDQQPSLVCYSTFHDRVPPLLSRSLERKHNSKEKDQASTV